MLGLADASIIKFLMTQVIIPPGYTGPELVYVYAPPDASRQALATAQGQKDIGIPGISIFRTGTAHISDQASKPLQAIGWTAGLNQDQHSMNLLATYPVMARYKLVAWCKFISDMNGIERCLSFVDAYKVITLNLPEPGLQYPNAIQFPVFGKEWDYEYIIQPQTGEVLWYKLTKSIDVAAAWTIGHKVPRVEEIVTNYQELVSGTPITYNALESININS